MVDSLTCGGIVSYCKSTSTLFVRFTLYTVMQVNYYLFKIIMSVQFCIYVLALIYNPAVTHFRLYFQRRTRHIIHTFLLHYIAVIKVENLEQFELHQWSWNVQLSNDGCHCGCNLQAVTMLLSRNVHFITCVKSRRPFFWNSRIDIMFTCSTTNCCKGQ